MLLSLLASNPAAAISVLRVPQDYPTIQAAIDAALGGDSVLVSPGAYVEQIDFKGKEITVESTDGPGSTIIDGNLGGTVVRILAGEGQRLVLRGFTIRNGYNFPDAGGIFAYGGPALIEGNLVTGNFGCDGAGIEASFSSATIRDNIVSGNRPNCTGGSGGGILVGGAGTANVLNNVITGNVAASDGGGISLFAAGSPTISNNVISDNVASGGSGGGISLGNSSDALITNNMISGNSAFQGGGIYWLVPLDQVGPNVVNNTVANNSAAFGTAVFADGFDAAARLQNNILAGSGSEAVLECGAFNDLNPPVIVFNDVFNFGSGPDYGGTCSDQTGLNGNISADPLFVDAASADFHIQAGSPAIDAGLNAGAPGTDIDGDPRPLDGNGDGVGVVDIGADEVRSETTPPTITCRAIPSTLWPPTHMLRPVSVDVSASDDSGSVTVTLVSVTSSQPDSGLDSEDLPNDIQGWNIGTDDRSGFLRAERFEEARIYTLTYQAEDPAGNTVICATTVTVPKSQMRG